MVPLWRSVVSVRFTALLLLLSPALAGCGSPFLVVHQQAFVRPTDFFTCSVYNPGSETAYDVSLVDDSWDQGQLYHYHGFTFKDWQRVDPGFTVSHSFILRCTVKHIFHGSPAVIQFRVLRNATAQVAYSTHIKPVDALGNLPGEVEHAEIQKIWERPLILYGYCGFVLLCALDCLYSIGKGKKKRHHTLPKSSIAKGKKKRHHTPSKSSLAKAKKKRH